MLIFGAWPLETPCVPQSGTGSNPHIYCCPSGLCQSALAGTEEAVRGRKRWVSACSPQSGNRNLKSFWVICDIL